MVSRARGKYGIKAPAVTGSDQFERIYRVHMNTLELLIALLPALFVAAKYWPVAFVAGTGLVYIVGRLLFLRAYLGAQSRVLGYVLSIAPVFILALSALVGAVLKNGAA
jgi:hypothetical protein